MQELFVYLEADVWAVRLGKYLLGTRPTQMEALELARAIAREIADRGVQSKLIVGDVDGNLAEIPTVDDIHGPAANSP